MRTRRYMESMVTTSAETLLQPSESLFLPKLAHVALDVNTVIREAYIVEAKQHFRPVMFLRRDDITKKSLDSSGAGFDYLWTAASFELRLYIMAQEAPVLFLTQNELDLLKPFVAKFSKATECFVTWFNKRDFHRLATQPLSEIGVKDPTSCLSIPEVERVLQSVPNLKEMNVCDAPRSYKLLTGKWTTNANEFNMDIIKKQMKENTKRKASL